MNDSHSDALVFFGATGDLAYKKIFPALQAMVKRGHLQVPVVGVAKAGWNLAQLQARAKDSIEKHGGIDPAAFEKLIRLLHYVDGDYKDPTTFQSLRKELGAVQEPAHYLAIPPALFSTVVEQLAKSGCTMGARVIIEKPFGHDLFSAQELNRTLLGAFDEKAIFPLEPKDVVRGQFRGYRSENGVAPNSQVETFVALQLQIDSWRWRGVPFYIRTGKCLPVTCTEVLVRLHQPPTMYHGFNLQP